MSTNPPPEFVRLRELTRGTGSSGADLTTVLQAIAEDAVEVTGFAICAIRVLTEDQHFELFAHAGRPDPQHPERIPAPELLRRLAHGERWGMLRYLPQPVVESLDGNPRMPMAGAHSADLVRDHPQAWQPRAELAAPLYSPTDELVGILHFDRPHDGLLPTQTSCELMELCAVQAGIAINAMAQRTRWQEQVWLTGMAREVIATTAGGFGLDDVLDQALATLRVELGARAAWLDVFSDPEPGAGEASRGAEDVTRVTAALRTQQQSLARRSLRDGHAVVLTRDDLLANHALLEVPDGGELARAMASDGVHSLALTALPVLDDLAGQLVLMRQRVTPWTTAEANAVQAMGHELGWAIGLDRSRRETAAANQGLLAVRREEATTAASLARLMSDSLDVVEDHLDRTGVPAEAPARTAIERLWEVLRHRLTLSSFEHPDRLVDAVRFDAGRLVSAHWQRLRVLATQRGVRLLPLDLSAARTDHSEEGPTDRVTVWADPAVVDWLLGVILGELVREAASGTVLGLTVAEVPDRLLVSCLVSPPVGIGPGLIRRLEDTRWWTAGATRLLSQHGGQLITRTGSDGRRVISIGLATRALSDPR